MNNIINRVPFLRTSREFPEDAHNLVREVNKSYVDIANAVNSRTIGLFPINQPAITGESWFINNSNQRQQTLRQVYNFGSIPSGSVNFVIANHGINFSNLSTFTVIRGIGFDGTNYFPIPYVDAGTPTANMGIFVSPTQILASTGAARVTQSGFILLEWLANP